MFPLIESLVAHRATSRAMLDRPTAWRVAFGDWATAYPQHCSDCHCNPYSTLSSYKMNVLDVE